MTIADTRVQKRILLIDDDEVVASSLHRYLTMNGCDVSVAVEPASAESLMKAHSYDVVVVDPYLTGGIHSESHALVDAIRRLQPRASLIVLTGYDSPTLVQLAANRSITALLTKPQSVVTLSRLISGEASMQPMNTVPIRG